MEEKLAKCSLFSNLQLNDITSLLGKIHFQKRTYQKEQVIAHADSEVSSLLVLIEGTVRGEMMDYSGKTIKIEDIEAPNLLAPAFLFGNTNKFPVTIVANRVALVLTLPKSSLSAYCK